MNMKSLYLVILIFLSLVTQINAFYFLRNQNTNPETSVKKETSIEQKKEVTFTSSIPSWAGGEVKSDQTFYVKKKDGSQNFSITPQNSKFVVNAKVGDKFDVFDSNNKFLYTATVPQKVYYAIYLTTDMVYYDWYNYWN